jgi:hypothetical protein
MVAGRHAFRAADHHVAILYPWIAGDIWTTGEAAISANKVLACSIGGGITNGNPKYNKKNESYGIRGIHSRLLFIFLT